ncbi:MAG: AmmeMemoRadiSam system protein A [Oscillospiraceae bacterium]|nr:AmmeMemoRadiSam system protein A [Oscillospiraceae bacterium]
MFASYLVAHPPLIVEGIGAKEDVLLTKSAYKKVCEEVEKINPETLVIVSPHSLFYENSFHISPFESASGDFGKFNAENVKFSVKYDVELAKAIGETADKIGIKVDFSKEQNPCLDHGVMVPLYFLKSKRKIVRISLSNLSLYDHYFFGISIKKAAEFLSKKIVLIASGDMSHKLKSDGPYGFSKYGREFDDFIQKCIKNSDFEKIVNIDTHLMENAGECGLRSLIILGGVMDGLDFKSEVLSYECPYGVGYLIAKFFSEGDCEKSSLFSYVKKKLDECFKKSSDIYVDLARKSIESYVKNKKKLVLSDEFKELAFDKKGVFVSIHKNGNLRGCIGTIFPVQENLAFEIIENSISAATKDSRFSPIAFEELGELEYKVDVLSDLQSVSNLDELNSKIYGVVVKSGQKRGVLLPDLDGVDTPQKQILIALSKAGIDPSEEYSIKKFTVIRHTEN